MPEENKNNSIQIKPAVFYMNDIRIECNEELFQYVFLSGKEATQYVNTPKMAKYILELLEQKISDYEKKYGTIELHPAPPAQKTPDPEIQ